MAGPLGILHVGLPQLSTKTEVHLYQTKQINLTEWTLDQYFSSFLEFDSLLIEVHLTPGPIYNLTQIFMIEYSCLFFYPRN